MKKAILSVAAALLTLGGAYAASDVISIPDKAPAFPGAEGFGRYVTGGRGGTVIHVTNLNDSGTGSLRAALSGTGKKIIVFDVSGYIDLKSQLEVTSNTTIAGQTAPGEGITLRYYTLYFGKCDNVIVRFIRSRRSQVKDVNDGADATWGRNRTGIIIDHCSFSWSIDEVASFYDNRDFTMQWTTVAEGLANPGHSKGEHSYGGIWGGKSASFHHNMIAHVQNRAPRFNGARYSWTGYDQNTYSSTVEAERVDFRNCLMYNWGTGSACYGGPGGGYINMINNYYKAGPGTKNKTTVTQVTVATSSNADTKHPELYKYSSRYYIHGNYVTAAGTSKAANYDWSGVKYDDGLTTYNSQKYIPDTAHYFGPNETYVSINGTDHVALKLTDPIDAGVITTHDATTAYTQVMAYCGASLYRDAVDARYMAEAKSGTVTYNGDVAYVKDGTTYAVSNTKGIVDFINDPTSETQYSGVPSYPELVSESRPAGFDTDKDGMPDEWEIANGLDPNNAADAKTYTLDTEHQWYTNVEVYINSLVEDIMKAGNADALTSVDEYYPVLPSAGTTGIREVANSSQVRTIEYYDLNGRRLMTPDFGISVRRTVYTDGHVVVDKVLK
jgi:hypothetical protein